MLRVDLIILPYLAPPKNEVIEIIEQFLNSEDVEVIRLTPEIFDRAFELYKTRPDKEWG